MKKEIISMLLVLPIMSASCMDKASPDGIKRTTSISDFVNTPDLKGGVKFTTDETQKIADILTKLIKRFGCKPSINGSNVVIDISFPNCANIVVDMLKNVKPEPIKSPINKDTQLTYGNITWLLEHLQYVLEPMGVIYKGIPGKQVPDPFASTVPSNLAEEDVKLLLELFMNQVFEIGDLNARYLTKERIKTEELEKLNEV